MVNRSQTYNNNDKYGRDVTLKGLRTCNCGQLVRFDRVQDPFWQFYPLELEVLRPENHNPNMEIAVYYTPMDIKNKKVKASISIWRNIETSEEGSEVYLYRDADSLQHYWSRNYVGFVNMPKKYYDIAKYIHAAFIEVFGEQAGSTKTPYSTTKKFTVDTNMEDILYVLNNIQVPVIKVERSSINTFEIYHISKPNLLVASRVDFSKTAHKSGSTDSTGGTLTVNGTTMRNGFEPILCDAKFPAAPEAAIMIKKALTDMQRNKNFALGYR